MDRPPYVVPSMAEVASVPRNGYRVASTFAGAGGSSTGYRMAGFEVVYANEFVPAAADTYRANMAAGTVLDSRDVRLVKPGDVLDELGLRPGELPVLDGSPPCASFSISGKRHAGWGEVHEYSDTDQRTDDLFYEFARLADGIRPWVFVAENVSGLVKGTAKGYFKRILARLEDAGYRVEARLLDASWLGVPQARQRVIFLGVRSDLPARPIFPRPLPYRYSIREALASAEPVTLVSRSGPSLATVATSGESPSPSGHTISHHYYRDSDQEHDPVWADDGKAYDQETGQVINLNPTTRLAREAAKLPPGASDEHYFNLTRPALDRPCPTVTSQGGNVGWASVVHPQGLRKFTLGELRAVCSFPPDYVLTGTYEQRWERLGRSVPPLMMRAIATTLRDEVLPQCQT